MGQSSRELSKDLASARDKLRGIGDALNLDGVTLDMQGKIRRNLQFAANLLNNTVTALETAEDSLPQARKEREKKPANMGAHEKAGVTHASTSQNAEPNFKVH
jgi:hypothetical protein